MANKEYRTDKMHMIHKEGVVYKQTEPYTCGPSSYMESYSTGKSRDLELSLHEKGRINPTRMFLGPSFLELDQDMRLYSSHNKITKEIVNMTYNPNVENFENKLVDYYKSLTEKHEDKIQKISSHKEISDILDDAHDKGKAALLLSDSSSVYEYGGAHWIGYKGKTDEGHYLFSDSCSGDMLKYTKAELHDTIDSINKKGFPMQILTK